MKKIYLSVVIPAFNESKRIGTTLKSLDSYLNKQSFGYEIIVVDDGSTDATAAVVKKLALDISNLKIITGRKNRGKGYSVNEGMNLATGETCLFMDADNSVDISHVGKFIYEIKNGYDVVIGSINVGHTSAVEHNGLHRRVLGKCANLLIQAVATPGIKDTQRGFKLFSRQAAHAVFSRQTIERWGFDIELLVIARAEGLKIKELPVEWNNAEGSKVTLKSYVQTLRELARVVFNRVLGRYVGVPQNGIRVPKMLEKTVRI